VFRWTETWFQMNASVAPCQLDLFVGNYITFITEYGHCCVHRLHNLGPNMCRSEISFQVYVCSRIAVGSYFARFSYFI